MLRIGILFNKIGGLGKGIEVEDWKWLQGSKKKIIKYLRIKIIKYVYKLNMHNIILRRALCYTHLMDTRIRRVIIKTLRIINLLIFHFF